jgi:excisionase family DNA binding protein
MRLLTPESVAETLSVSRSTVLRMIADGALPAVVLRRGKRKAVYRIRQEALERWVMSRERQGTVNSTVKRTDPPTTTSTDPMPVEINRANGDARD